TLDPASVFHYYRALIRLRKERPVIVYGRYDMLLAADQEIYAFTRSLEDERLLVILNFSASTPVFALPTEVSFASAEALIANYEIDRTEAPRLLTLRPYEARVYSLRT